MKNRRIITLLALLTLVGVKLQAQVPCWDGTVAEAYAGGDGTDGKPYQIATPQQLALLAQQTNNGTGGDAYYILTEDLCMNGSEGQLWPPIGLEPFAFTGHFDGDNHTISDLYVYNNITSGLFGTAENAIIKNIRIDNSTISFTTFLESSCVGFIAGRATDTNITDCIAEGSITQNYAFISGGIVGEFIVSGLSEDTITIRNCEHYGEITGFFQVGGIAGYTIAENEKILIEGCVNHGDLSCSEVGGMIGRGSFILKNCQNYGKIDGNSAGGMVGHGNGFGIITYCTNHESGEVRGECAGGIIGTAIYTTMSMCVNKASIIGDKGHTTFVGGIAGGNGSFSNCFNRGDISCDLSNNVPGAVQMGGIAGTPCTEAFMYNVYNTGAIVKVDHPNVYSKCYGIIIPVIRTDTVISNCYWYGEYDVPPCQININDPGSPVTLPGSCPFAEGATPTTWTLEEAQYNTTDLLEALNQGAMGECVWVEDVDGVNDGFPIFAISPTQSINEQHKEAKKLASAYPNPGKNILHIQTELRNAGIKVYDMSGKIVHHQEIANNRVAINADAWPKGVYVWKVYTSVSTGSTALMETGKWIKE